MRGQGRKYTFPMPEILLANLVGTDRPGLTDGLLRILSEHNVRLLDMGQAVIHEHLSLGMLLQLPDGSESFAVLKQLLYRAHELGLSVRFTPVSEGEYEHWVGLQGQERNVVTVLGASMPAEALASVTGELLRQGLNIEKISRLSQRPPLDDSIQRVCMEFSVLGAPLDRDALRAGLLAAACEHGVDIAVQADDMYRRNRRVVVFDMDSTLIQCEVIDELAKMHGVGDEVSAITEAAMRGELDFRESFTKRLGLLRGMPESRVAELADRLPLMDGAERLIGTLKRLGFTTAICSGGFQPFGERLRERLGIDHVFANVLESEDGALTGRVVEPIVDGARKAELMRQIAEVEGVSLEQCVAVGDGANDLPMIQQAGLGIAFRAKPMVRARADQAINVLGLDGILYLIGVRDRDLLRLR